MKEDFNSEVPRIYSSEKRLETPFDNTEHIADYLKTIERREKIRWMVGFLILVSLLAISVTGNVVQGISAKVEPIFVPIDTANMSIPTGLRVGSQSKYDPPEEMYVFFVSEFIKNVRAKTLDSVVNNNNLQKGKQYLLQVASNKLDNIVRTEKINEPEKNTLTAKTIQVNVNNIIPVTATDKNKTYQARWEEVLYNEVGEVVLKRNLTGMFITERIASTDLQTVVVNPLGLYITDFSWDKDLK